MTSVILTDLPLEILEMIANRICNSQGYLSFRLSCKKCYFSTRSIKKYFKDGELSEYLPLRGGVPHGKSYCYFLNGNVSMEKTFIKGIQQDEEKLYYFSKRILFRGKVINGKKEGLWYERDNARCFVNYANGERHGAFKSIYSNGLTYQIGQFVHGQMNGQWRSWYYDGFEESIMNFDNNTLSDAFIISSLSKE